MSAFDSAPQMELRVQLPGCFDGAPVRLGSQFRSIMKRAVLACRFILLPSALVIIARHNPLSVLKVRMVNPL
jgi:hypothetical protein